MDSLTPEHVFETRVYNAIAEIMAKLASEQGATLVTYGPVTENVARRIIEFLSPYGWDVTSKSAGSHAGAISNLMIRFPEGVL